MNKSLITCIAGAALLFAGCTAEKYDDSALVKKVDDLQEKVDGIGNEVNTMKETLRKLREDVDQLQTDVSGFQAIVNKVNEAVYISGVQEIKDARGGVLGYTITFTDRTTVTIYHGEDGTDGKDGKTPSDGKDGNTPYIGPNGNWWIDGKDTGVQAEAKDGISPVLNVVLEGDVYYWTITIDGKTDYLRDAAGEKVAATAGKDGVDGKTPEFRVTDDGMLQVTYDTAEPKTWTDLGQLSITSEVRDQIFSDVKESSEAVTFLLSGGGKIVIPKDQDFVLVFGTTRDMEIAAGATSEIPYTLQGGDAQTTVDAFGGADWQAEADYDGKTGGKIYVTAGNAAKAKVLVYAVDGKGSKTDIKTLSFIGGTLEAVYPATEVPVGGGDVPVSVTTNVAYQVNVDPDASDWISWVQTKAGAVRTDELVFTLKENTTPVKREGQVMLTDVRGAVIQTLVFVQEAGNYTVPTFPDANFKKYILSRYDKNGDGTLSAEEAGAVTEISYKETNPAYYWESGDGPVSSFEGVEALYNLTSFRFEVFSGAFESSVSSIDLRSNKKLESVYVIDNKLAELKLGGLARLRSITIGNCSGITSLDLSGMTALTSLSAYNTGLKTVNLTGCPQLTSLALYGSKISFLNTAGNPLLRSASVGCATLLGFDFSKNTALTSLSLDNVQVEEADFSALTLLTSFSANGSKLKDLDLSHSPLLKSVSMRENRVSTVDVSAADRLETLNLQSSPVLAELRLCGSDFVREKVAARAYDYPTGNWWEDEKYHEVKVIFGDYEEPVIDDYAACIADEFVRKYITGKYDTDGDGKLNDEEAAQVTRVDLSDMAMSELTGLENFPIEELNLSGNKLTGFNAEKFTALRQLDLSDNLLTSVDLSAAKELTDVDLSHNRLSGSIGYSQIPYNNLTRVNVSDNPELVFSPYLMDKLTYLDMSYTGATSLSGTASLGNVKTLKLNGSQISGSLSLSGAKSLEVLDIRNTAITQIDVTGAAAGGTLQSILAKGSQLTLIVIGSGNSLAEGVLSDKEGVNILDAANPTREVITDRWGYLSGLQAGDHAEVANLTINFATQTQGLVIEAGGSASFTVKTTKKKASFFAIGVGGTPQVTLSRSSGKAVLTPATDNASWGTDKSLTDNPFTVRQNAKASQDERNLVIDGNDDWYFFNFCKPYTTETALTAGETVTFTVSGKAGEKVIIFGINLGGREADEG